MRLCLGRSPPLDNGSPQLFVTYLRSIFHRLISNSIGCNFLKYVTLFSCDTFGFYVSWVYLQYGIQVLTREFVPTDSPGAQGVLVSIILAILMLVTSFLFQSLSRTPYFHRHARRFFADYGMPISLIAASAMAYWGRFGVTNPVTLPTAGTFQAAGGRKWIVRFWEIESKWVGIALPFGIILWILFFFDHNVSVSLLVLIVLHVITSSVSHLWLKDLNFHFENHQDSITTSSSLELLHLLQASLAYLLLMGLYLRHPFTLGH